MFERFNKMAQNNTVSKIKEQSLTKGKLYFEHCYSDTRKTWFFKKGLSRELIVTINRLRANHYNLAESLSRIKIISSPLCAECNEIQDINHVLWQCKLYEKERKKLMPKIIKLQKSLPVYTRMFIIQPNVTICREILKFLKNCNLKI